MLMSVKISSAGNIELFYYLFLLTFESSDMALISDDANDNTKFFL